MGIGNAKRHRAGPPVARFALFVGLSVGPLIGPLIGLIVGLIVGLAASADSRAAAPAAIDGVTYGQPKVVPTEFNGDLAKLSPLALSKAGEAPKVYRPRLQGPLSTKVPAPNAAQLAAPQFSGPLAPMPSPTQNFAGMNFNDICSGVFCGGGWPPDPNGDVGPNHYILAVNNAVAIYNKTGTLLASFSEENLWAGSGAAACTNASTRPSQGDPVVLYDWLADRFILTWFAFSSSGTSQFYQCIAASKTSDPVAGGWWLYAVRTDIGTLPPLSNGLPPIGDMNDYGKFGLWHDCLYMGANEFNGNAYDGVMFASFSRADLYSGAALTYAMGWLPPSTNAFTLVPSNNQGAGAKAAQPGTPNYFVSTAFSTFDFEVRTFTPGADCGGGGTLSAPTLVSLNSYTFQQGNIVPQPNDASSSFKLDMIDDRVMQKVQYRNVGGAESLWVVHPVQNPSGSNTALQWAQIDVTGGTIATTPVQQQIHSPDNTLYRFMGSLAVDNRGNMALGYTTSNGSSPNFPSIKYAGRLSTDPLNTLPQTEVTMIAGSGSQKNTCGSAPCHRWGDYSSMSVDPADDCTFWYVNEYYSSQINGTNGNWQTRIGSFKFPSCTSGPPTTTVLGSSLNPSIVGNSVTFTATVTGTGATPTGNVAFADGPVTLAGCGSVALDVAGVAQCPAGALSFGFHSILATYGGDLANGGSHSARLLQAMNPVGGGYNVALAANGGTASVSSAYSALFPATSLNNNERAGSPWGAGGGWNDATLNAFPDTAQVLFGGGNKTIKTVVVYTLQDGYLGPIEPTDTLTFTKFGVRDFAVQGWNGSSWFNLAPPITGNNLVKRVVNFAPTSTDRVRVNITATADNWSRLTEIEAWTAGPPPAATTTGLASSLNASTAGAAVTFTATVLGAAPTGNVAFTDGGVTIPGCGAIALSGSTAQCPVSNLSVATHSIVAIYAGDVANFTSTSTPLSQVVNKATSTTGVGTSGTPSTGGQSVTFTATVNGYLPAGTVAFTDGVATIAGCGSVALTGAVISTRTAPCTTSALGVATHSITATFSGDVNNTVSASTPLSQVVNQATSTTAVSSSLNPSSTGVAVTFTATVNGFAPTGNVGFTSDAASIGCDSVALSGGGNARTAQCTTSSLSVATHSIVATYGGDGANTGSVSPALSQGVSATPVTTNVALASNAGVASVSSVFSAGYPAASLNNDERTGSPWGSGGGWNSGANTFPQWAQINFAGGSKTINKVVVYSVQDSYASPVEPSDVQTFTKFGVTIFAVQRWTGTAWVTITTISGNNLVKRSVNFAPTATDRIRILITGSVDGWSRLTEVEAWTTNLPAPAPTSTAVGSSLNPSIKNAAVTYTATVTGSSPTSTVAFTENGTTIPGCAAVAVSLAGAAPCPTTTNKVGTRSIVATYGGDLVNLGSVSPTLSQVVTRN